MKTNVPNRNLKWMSQWPPVKKIWGSNRWNLRSQHTSSQHSLVTISVKKKKKKRIFSFFFLFLLFCFLLGLHCTTNVHGYLHKLHSVQKSQPFLFCLISGTEREWKPFWGSYLFLSQQVKHCGNSAVCTCRQGWTSGREFGQFGVGVGEVWIGNNWSISLMNVEKIQYTRCTVVQRIIYQIITVTPQLLLMVNELN